MNRCRRRLRKWPEGCPLWKERERLGQNFVRVWEGKSPWKSVSVQLFITGKTLEIGLKRKRRD